MWGGQRWEEDVALSIQACGRNRLLSATRRTTFKWPTIREFSSPQKNCYDLIRVMEDRASSALARIASVLALRKSRKVQYD